MNQFIYKKYTTCISAFAIMCVVAFALFSSFYATNTIRSSEMQGLLLRAGTVSLMINQNDLKNFSGDSSDLQKPEYQNTKKILENIHALNTDTRFVYLMGLHPSDVAGQDPTQFFYVDSEDPSSKDYSPPGQAYTDATPTDIYNHVHGISYTSGPYHDAWGDWISGYAPIKDSQTGEVLALVGIDIDASHLLSEIRFARILIGSMSFFMLLSIILLTRLMKKSTRYMSTLENLNQDLQTSKNYMMETEKTAGLGQCTWNMVNNEIILNPVASTVLDISESKISTDEFFRHMLSADSIRIKEEISLLSETADSATLKYHILDTLGKEHTVASVCKIKRGSKNELLRMICTVQDVTDK